MEPAVEFRDVTFAYPADNPDDTTDVFTELTSGLPAAMTAVVGQNGVGKSTLLLLAGGRIFPDRGTVKVLGTDTSIFKRSSDDPEVEEQRNRLVSFVYQNMEFETTESVGDLMELVYRNGFHETDNDDLLNRLRRELELEPFLGKRTQELAKGQLQRAIIAFSLLYGSRMIIMDEPVFALEEPQKDRTFALLHDISHESGVPILYSVHNLDLSQRYSDNAVLFTGNGEFTVGPTGDLLARENLEAAYRAPMDTLHQRDRLYREILLGTTRRDR